MIKDINNFSFSTDIETIWRVMKGPWLMIYFYIYIIIIGLKLCYLKL